MSTPDQFVQGADVPTAASTPPDFMQIAKDLAAGIVDSKSGDWLAGKISDGLRAALVAFLGFLIKEITTIVGYFAEIFVTAMQEGDLNMAKLSAVIVGNLFDVPVSEATFAGATGPDQRHELARRVGAFVIKQMFGENLGDTPQQLTPSSANAESFAGLAMQLSLDGFYQDVLGELVTLGQIKDFGHLADNVIRALGIGRMMRRVLSPASKILIEDPFTRKLNLAFRPKELSEAQLVKQLIRGRWDMTRLDQELGKQGYGADAIEAAINDARKFLSESELAVLVRYGTWTLDQAVQHLRDQGYEEPIARAKMDLQAKIRDQQLLQFLIGELETAVLKGFLDNEGFRTTLSKFPIPPDEIDLRARMIAVRVEIPRKDLTVAEITQAFKLNVFDLQEFRQKILDLGYRAGDETTLELINLTEIKSKQDAADAKTKAAQEKAAAKTAAAATKAQQKADAAATRQAAATAKATAKAQAQSVAEAAKQTKADAIAAARSQTKAANDTTKEQLAAARKTAADAKAAAKLQAQADATAKKAADRAAAKQAAAAALAEKKAAAGGNLSAALAAKQAKTAAEKAAADAQKAAADAMTKAQAEAAKVALEAQKAALQLQLEQLKLAAAQARAARPAPAKRTTPAKKTSPAS